MQKVGSLRSIRLNLLLFVYSNLHYNTMPLCIIDYLKTMLKTQNAPPDHVTVTRLGLRKHKYEIRGTVSLVHNKLKNTLIFLKETF